jgi:hypothetical protein
LTRPGVLSALRANIVDLALTAEPQDADGFAVEALWRESWSVVLPRGTDSLVKIRSRRLTSRATLLPWFARGPRNRSSRDYAPLARGRLGLGSHSVSRTVELRSCWRAPAPPSRSRRHRWHWSRASAR